MRIADLAAVDDGQLVSLKRGYTEGAGNSVRLCQISLEILGTTTHSTADWVTQTIRSLVTDVQDAGVRGKFLIATAMRSTPPSSTRSSPTPTSAPSSPAYACSA
ncbi:hypothetical protein [Streptomyces sp. AcE210]|uniref:hypothetical protein n=1 Tax=Streptomyces sp. AcE210 TaxID=2292703 RepID=UPI001F0BC3CC|nr:hypothetical protein [Streptomyces sp. AcE210]